MNECLTALAGTEGVTGCAMFDQDGRCVETTFGPPYDPELLDVVLHGVSGALEVFAALDSPPTMNAFVAQGQGGGLVVRRFGRFLALALTTPEVSLAKLGVAFNVVALKLRRSEGLPDSMSLGGGSHSSNRRSWGASHPGASQPPPADAAGRQVLRQLLGAYSQRLGPAAKPVLGHALTQLGTTARTLRRGQYPDLVAILAERLPDDQAREQFIRDALALLPDR